MLKKKKNQKNVRNGITLCSPLAKSVPCFDTCQRVQNEGIDESLVQKKKREFKINEVLDTFGKL